MARHGENIYKRKDGRYEGRYVIDKTFSGKTRFGYVYGHPYAEVKKALLLKKEATDLYIFGFSNQPAEPQTVQRHFKALAKKLGIKNVHFHTLRHSFSTRLVELGVDIKPISTRPA